MRGWKPLLIVACICVLGVGPTAAADEITVGTETYTDAYVRESDTLYYIQFPETGLVISVPKDKVAANAVRIDPDEEAREELLARWNSAREARSTGKSTDVDALLRDYRAAVGKLPKPDSNPASASANASSAMENPGPHSGNPVRARNSRTRPGNPSGKYVTDGIVYRIKLDNVRLESALKALLRPLNLDYEVRDGYIFITSPDRVQEASEQDLEVRYYDLDVSGETLPKIVLMNPGGFGGSQQFSNIAQLFSRIDDRLVGETPAVIGLSSIHYRGN